MFFPRIFELMNVVARSVFFLLLGAVLSFCDDKSGRSANRAFDEDLESLKEYFHIPGMAAIVTENGNIKYEKYFGFADLDTRRPVDSATLFPIASVTKTFAAVLLMQLVEDGKLDLDEPVNKYVPERSFPDDIRIRHVMSHTSEGIPGTFFNYSGRFGLLTAVIEQAAGKSIPELLKNKILNPLQLENTLPLASDSVLDLVRDRIAKPYYYYGEVEDGHFDTGFNASSGIASTVRDLSRFDHALSGGVLISGANRIKMFSPFPISHAMSPYGMGVFTQDFMEKKIIWAYGQEDCYSSLLLKIPEDNLTLILLANNNLMSDPARLINGDVTFSLFAMSFLKHFVFEISSGPNPIEADALIGSGVDFAKSDYAVYYRQAILARAIAASFIGHADHAEFEKSRQLVDLAVRNFPNLQDHSSQSLLILLTTLSKDANVRDYDQLIEQVGDQLLQKNPMDPYANIFLGFHYQHINNKQKALEHFSNIAEAQGFQPFWYTIMAYDFLGDYYKSRDHEMARTYFQNIVDIGWNIAGKLDKAKSELEKL